MSTTLTYCFSDCLVTLVGPGVAITLGDQSGSADEGITVEMSEDKMSMIIGADGTAMPVLHAGNGGTVTVRLLRNSPTNALLSAAYNFQSLSTENSGQNLITIRQKHIEDIVTCSAVGFQRLPRLSFGKDPAAYEWPFVAGSIKSMLAMGTL